MKRFPAVSGSFYPANVSALKKTIDNYLYNINKKINAIGLISPHAGYVYSGKTAGQGYSNIEKKDIYIIISPNHYGDGEPVSIMTEGEWIIPIGSLKIDKIAKDILKSSVYLKDDQKAHFKEHSIEVQLPFIKTINPSATFVPISIMDYSDKIIDDLSNAIVKSIVKIKERVLLIASTDMTHYEPQEIVKSKDMMIIENIKKLDVEGMISTIKLNNITACGWGPVAIVLKAAKSLGAKKAELIDYSNSGDASFDYSEVVGYASLAIF